MATKTKKETEKTENIENLEEKIEAQEPEDQTEEKDDSTDNQKEPEKKESFGTKAKGFGKKVLGGVKKALPYVGAFAAGAGAAVGALVVLTRPDGTETELLPQNDDLIPADEFIEGEAVVVDDAGTEE